MGVYAEYLEKLKHFPDIVAERKKQLARIAELRGNRDILVIASDWTPKGPFPLPVSIAYDDLLPIRDQLDNLNRGTLDVILETPGGIAEIAEDIVNLIRGKFSEVAFIVPGAAKSAGTIMVMAGDEILMDDASSLGPIDPPNGLSGRQSVFRRCLSGRFRKN